MTSIELTDLHKSKLLEMCNFLFPEYKEIEFRICFGKYENNLTCNENIRFLDNDKWTEIHWFEFCFTKLVNKLYDNIDYTDSDEFNINLHVELMMDMVNFKTNPIDFLHREFLKTKTSDK